MARLFRPDGLLNNASFLRGNRRTHERLQTDDYFSDSDADSDLEDQRAIQGTPVRRVLQAKTALPQDISFTVPDNTETEAGMEVVCIQGPHGPLRVPLPDGAKAGEECSIRLGPPAQYHVTVPEGGKPGDSVKFAATTGEELNATVPSGKKPGEKFEVSLPVLLIQVPQGARPGTEVMYEAPDRQNRCARVPKGCCPGHYFPVLILPPGHDVLVAEATWPVELSFTVPDRHDGKPVCLQGPHGPIMVPIPDGSKPGQQCSYRLGPPADDGYEVTVPEGAHPGEAVKFQGTDGETLHATVPEGKAPGEKFRANLPKIMVRVPPNAHPGTEIMFQTPGEQMVRFTRVPREVSPGTYFAVLLHPQAPATEESRRRPDENGYKQEDAPKKQEKEEAKVEEANLIDN